MSSARTQVKKRITVEANEPNDKHVTRPIPKHLFSWKLNPRPVYEIILLENTLYNPAVINDL